MRFLWDFLEESPRSADSQEDGSESMVERGQAQERATALMFLVILLVLLAEFAAGGAIVHESATLGPTGQTYGWGVGETQFLGG